MPGLIEIKYAVEGAIVMGSLVGATWATLKVKQVKSDNDHNGRRKLMSQEAHDEITRIWEQKQGKDMCKVMHKNIIESLADIKREVDHQGQVITAIALKNGVSPEDIKK